MNPMFAPNDSAISVAAESSEPSATTSTMPPKPPSPPAQTPHQQPQSNSPREAPATAHYEELSPEERVVADAESNEAALQAEHGIELDSAESDSDPGYETDSIQSTSTSISSSVYNFAFENGRRYHSFREGRYSFPNDPSEQDREDLKHAMMRHLCGQRLHFAPIGDNPQHILDMGTGTGIWAIEMGDLFPSADVLGVDLSPIQPLEVPPNVHFMVDDVESLWLKPQDYYDYVHARHMVMGIRNWPRLMGQVLTHLKPGGYLELQEMLHYPYTDDNSMSPDHPVAEFWRLIAEALSALGVNFHATLVLPDMMREAGFINVETRILNAPIGPWAKNEVLKLVGLFWRTILMDGLEPIALGPLTRGLGWSKEEVFVFLVRVRIAYNALKRDKVHAYMPCYIITGQKPFGPSTAISTET